MYGVAREGEAWEWFVGCGKFICWHPTSHAQRTAAVRSRHSTHERHKKKRETLVSLLVYPEPWVEVRSTRANTIKRRPHGRAINSILFAQPLIKVSTAATGEVLVARIKRSFEGDVCVRQVYLLMSTNIALRHAVPLATNTTLKTKKREKLSFLSHGTQSRVWNVK